MFKASVLVFLLVVWAHLGVPNNISDIYFTRVDCIDHNEALCRNNFCNVKRFRNNSNLLTVGCEVTVMSSNLLYRATAYYKFGAKYKLFLFNMTASVCDVLNDVEKHKTSAAINVFLEPIQKYSNAVHPCPHMGNYSLMDMPATAMKLPPLMPAGDYRIDFRIFNSKNKTYLFPRFYFTIKAKGINILEMG